ncbi:MAG: signal peptidase II [Methyloligellaceae bacterium]
MGAVRRFGVACAAIALALDQASKALALAATPRLAGGVEILPVFDLVLVRNSGVSFGLLGSVPWPALAFIGLIIVAILAAWLWRVQTRLLAGALGLVIGGALGNVLDRARSGAVTDFLDFHLAGYHWPAFNLADIAVVAGTGLLLLGNWRTTERPERTAA